MAIVRRLPLRRELQRYNAPHTSAVGTSDDANALAPSGSISRRYQRRRPPSALHGFSRAPDNAEAGPGAFPHRANSMSFRSNVPQASALYPILEKCLASHSMSAGEGSRGAAADPTPFAPSPAACDTGVWGRAGGKGRGLVPLSPSQAEHGRARRSFPRNLPRCPLPFPRIPHWWPGPAWAEGGCCRVTFR